MKLTERLGKEWVFFDGGMGTILQAHGLKAGELPETWNLSHPDEIIALNRSYFEAGCDVVNTNTFGANALKYPDNLREIVEAAVNHASASVTVTAPGRSLPVSMGSKYHIQKITKISGMPRINSAQINNPLRTVPGKRQAQQARTIPPGKASSAAPRAINNVSRTPPGCPSATRPHRR